MSLSIGFTGTQLGMTDVQKSLVCDWLTDLKGEFFHHGDCIGSDKQAHEIARSLGYKIILHPPIIADKRAFCTGAEVVYPQEEYLVRNRVIVTTTTILIATPFETEERLRSGTWSTIRYARKLGRSIRIAYP